MAVSKEVLEVIKIASDEINEEMDALLEGGNTVTSRAVIRKILTDLLHTIENPEKEMNEEDIDDTFEEDEMKYTFKVGQKVKIEDSYYPDDDRVYVSFGYEKDCNIYDHGFERDGYGTGKTGMIKRRKKDPLFSKSPCYLVETEDAKYFCLEWMLKKA